MMFVKEGVVSSSIQASQGLLLSHQTLHISCGLVSSVMIFCSTYLSIFRTQYVADTPKPTPRSITICLTTTDIACRYSSMGDPVPGAAALDYLLVPGGRWSGGWHGVHGRAPLRRRDRRGKCNSPQSRCKSIIHLHLIFIP